MQINVKNCKLIELKKIVDEKDGILSVAEQNVQIPFEIKRVYHIYGLNDISANRGYHAHKKLEQVIFCINGSFKLITDDGNNKNNFILNNPNKGIYIGKNLWHTMSEFSQDCIILVFASDFFNESDYIRDYNKFLKYIEELNWLILIISRKNIILLVLK